MYRLLHSNVHCIQCTCTVFECTCMYRIRILYVCIRILYSDVYYSRICVCVPVLSMCCFAAVSHTVAHKQSFLAQRTLPPSGTTAGLSHHAIQPEIPSISQRTITNSKTRPKGLRIAWVLKQIRPEGPINDLSRLAPVSWEL